jgi:hypothetical protein
MCLRLSPCWFAYPCASAAAPITRAGTGVGATAKNICLCMSNMPELDGARLTLVSTTISSRGRLCCLIALPRISSERPFEYSYTRIVRA